MADREPVERPELTPVPRWWCCGGTVTHCWCPHRPLARDDDGE